MPLRLDTRSPDFAVSFNALLAMKREVAEDVDQAVQAIIADVIAQGDAALIGYSRKFDRVDLAKLGLRVGAADIDAAFEHCPPEALDALRFAHARIIAFHERQLPQDHRFTDPLGVELGWRWLPDRGGRALCSGWHGELPIFGFDERGAGQGCRR